MVLVEVASLVAADAIADAVAEVGAAVAVPCITAVGCAQTASGCVDRLGAALLGEAVSFGLCSARRSAVL